MEAAASGEPAKAERLLSLDTLRGFDMFWIAGGETVFATLRDQLHWPWFNSVVQFFTEHVEWEGFRFYDLIFPLFLFIIGVTLPYSIGKRLEHGDSKGQIAAKVVRRTLMLILLGLIYNGLLNFEPFDHLRLAGVLQRQALGYCFAGFAFLYLKPRGQAIIGTFFLIAYWLILKLSAGPGHPAGDMSEWGNYANYLDRTVFAPGQMYEKYGDPEGILSTIPAFSTALLGLLTGQFLKSDRQPSTKALWIFLAGVISIGLGLLWGIDFPIIKKLWTSSYVLVAGGASMVLLAAFYWIVDVKGWRRWTLFFVVIGVNPITIYMAQCFIDFDNIGKFFAGGIAGHSGAWGAFILAVAGFTARWLFLLFLHRKKVYLRV